MAYVPAFCLPVSLLAAQPEKPRLQVRAPGLLSQCFVGWLKPTSDNHCVLWELGGVRGIFIGPCVLLLCCMGWAIQTVIYFCTDKHKH